MSTLCVGPIDRIGKEQQESEDNFGVQVQGPVPPGISSENHSVCPQWKW